MNNILLLLFSGGPDSVYLYYYLKKKNPFKDFIILHIDYKKRESSKIEEKFCINFCIKNKIKYISYKYKSKKNKTSNNFQESARNYRYKKAFSIAAKYKIKKIFTGHNFNDNVETILMQKQRNLKLSYYGMSKHYKKNVFYLEKPLLKIQKKKILLYLNKNKIKYITDETNILPIYTRNIVRNSYSIFFGLFLIHKYKIINFFLFFVNWYINYLYKKLHAEKRINIYKFNNLPEWARYKFLIMYLKSFNIKVNKNKIKSIMIFLKSCQYNLKQKKFCLSKKNYICFKEKIFYISC